MLMLVVMLVVMRSLRWSLVIAATRHSVWLGWIVVVWLWALRKMRLWGSIRTHWHHYARISNLLPSEPDYFAAYCVGAVAGHTSVDRIGLGSYTRVVVLDESSAAPSLELPDQG